MKKIFLLIVAATFCLGLSSQTTEGLQGSRACSMRKSSLPYTPALPGAQLSVAGHSFDVIRYTLDLNIRDCFLSPYPNNFTGIEKILFRVDSTLNTIKLNCMNSSIQVMSVGQAAVSFGHVSNILTLNLDQTYNPGDTVEVQISYNHKNVDDDAFYASNGMVFTDAEPEGARKWFPCWDRPSDKAKTDIRVKVPGNTKVGSNGSLADSLITGDTIYYHWVSAHDVATYLTVLSGKVNYKLDIVYWENPNTPGVYTPMRFYYNSGESPYAMEALIGPLTTYFSEHYCDHPFEKNGFASLNSEFSWGGMENQTLTNICPGCWQQWLIVHEFAHQWFGDMITCATWADIWLNEGFATWSEAFWAENSGGYDAYKTSIEGEADSYFSGNPGWPISDPAWAVNTPPNNVLFNYAITYAKGACVLHQLRYVLGDDDFFQLLSSYAADPVYKYKSATIGDFNAKVNEITGDDYTWFFDEWIYEPNHPVYVNTYNFEDLGAGQWKVNLFLTQVQPDPDFFKMPVDIWIRFSDYTDTVVRIMNDANYQGFNWTFGKQPINLQFDKENEIVLKEASTVVGITEHASADGSVTLLQNIPNPASGQTRIVYLLARPADVELTLSDLAGKRIRTLETGSASEGKHEVILNTSDLSSGLYYYTLKAGGMTLTRKLAVTK